MTETTDRHHRNTQFGVDAFSRAVEHGLRMAEFAESVLRAGAQEGKRRGWEVVTEAQLGVVTFRWGDTALTMEEEDKVVDAVVQAMLADGFAVVTSTIVGDRPVLRLCPIHPSVTHDDIEMTLERLAIFAVEACSGDSAVLAPRDS